MTFPVRLYKNYRQVRREQKDGAIAVPTKISNEEWYRRNGYYSLADRLGGVENSAFTLGAMFGGMKIISEDVARLPLKPYEYADEAGSSVREYYNSMLYERLMYEPNPEMTPMGFREAMTANAILGTAYAKVERRPGGKPMDVRAMWPLRSKHVTRKRNDAGYSYFVYDPPNGKREEIASGDMLQLRGFSMDGEQGCDLLRYAARVLRIAIAQETYAEEFFGNDHTPGVVLSSPETIGPSAVAALKEAWKRSVRSHDIAVLQGGMKADRWGQTNTDAQLSEQRLQELWNVCRFLRLMPAKLGDMSKMTYGNYEQVIIQYYSETISPWLTRWEQEIWRTCIRDTRIYVRHTEHALLRADFKTQTEGFARLLEKGVYSINEVRALMNMNPIEGGDAHHIQLNMQSVQQASEAVTNSPDAPTGEVMPKAFGQQWLQVVGRRAA